MAGKKSCRRARGSSRWRREGARARGRERADANRALSRLAWVQGVGECHAGRGREPRDPCSRRQRGLSVPRVAPARLSGNGRGHGASTSGRSQGACGGPAWGRAREGRGPGPRPPGAHSGRSGPAPGNGTGGRGGGAASGPGWAGGFGPAVAQAGGAGAGSGTSGGRPGAQARPQETAGRDAPCAAWHIPAVRLHPPPHIPGDKKSFAPAKVARVNIKKAALPEKRECPSRTRERPCSP